MNRYLLATELDIKYKHFRTYLKKMEHQRKYGLQIKEIWKLSQIHVGMPNPQSRNNTMYVGFFIPL